MRSQQIDISDLIRRARQGEEPGAIERVLDAYRNYLALLARTSIDTSLRGKADASDLVQETLLKAYAKFDQFTGQTEPEIAAWLRQILARNLADLARRFQMAEARQVSRERSLEASLDRSSQMLGKLIAADGDTPSQLVARRELSVVLADAMADLSDDHREVIVLRNLEELDWPEIASKMDRTLGAVRMLWARALKQLRPLIEGRL